MNAVTPFEYDARTFGVDYFNPDDYLIAPLRRAAANGQDLHIRVAGQGELLLQGSRGEYFAEVDDMAAFLTISPELAEVKVYAAGNGITSPSTGRNIDELMWQVAFYASGGRLMHGCYRDDVVELEQWPNLSRLPHTPNTMRIAALLARRPTSISLAARLLKIEPAEIYQFYSAARTAGIAKPVNRPTEEPKLEPHRQQTLLSSLLKKIASL